MNLKTGQHLGGIGAAPTPPSDRALSTHDEESETKLSFGNSFSHAFTFPLTGHGIQMIITMPVMAIVASFMPFLGLIMPFAYLGLYYGCLIDVMRSASGGLRFKPEIQLSDFVSEMLLPGLKLVIVMLVVAFVPFVAAAAGLGIGAAALGLGPDSGSLTSVLFGSAAGLSLLAVLIFIAVYLPMSVAISGIYNAVIDAVNPVVIFRSIAKIPGEYALVALFLYGLIGVSMVLQAAMSVHWTLSLLAPAVSFYLNAVAVSRLGFMSHTNKEKLGW